MVCSSRTLVPCGSLRVWFRHRLFAYGPEPQGMFRVLRSFTTSDPMNRFTRRDFSSHGIDITSNTLKTRSSKGVATWGRPPIGIGHKVLSAQLDIQEILPRHNWAPFDNFHLDTHDFYNSDFLDNSSSGVGGWGDPTNDYQISTGGFKDMVVAYPSPHHIRRNFTLFPLANPPFNPFAGDPAAPPLQVDLMINTTMTKQNVDHSVNNFEGDFIGLQTYTEGLPASPILPPLIFDCPEPFL